MNTFLDQCTMFESAKPLFAHFYNVSYPINNCLGVKQNEIEEYKQLLGSLTLKIVNKIYSQQTYSMITHQRFLVESIIKLHKNDYLSSISKVIIDLIEKKTKTVKHLPKKKIISI